MTGVVSARRPLLIVGPVSVPRPTPAVAVIWLTGLAGLALRLWVILVYRPTCEVLSSSCYKLAADAWYTHSQAQLISQGHWFKIGTDFFMSGTLVNSAGDPPLYPLFLGAWSRLGLASVTWHRVVSTLFGLALIVLVGLLARRLAGDIAGITAAVLAAIHPLLWINDVMLLSEGMYQPAIVLILWAAYIWIDHPDRRRIVVVGVAIAVAALIRAESVSLFGFLIIPLVAWRTRLPHRERIHQIGLAWMAGLLVMAPWLVFNNLRFDRPVTLTSASGNVLMAGSCDAAWSGELMGIWATCFEQRNLLGEYEAALPGVSDQAQGWIKYDESVRDEFMTRHAISYTLDHWERYPLVALARVGRSLELFKVGNTLRFDYEIEGRWRAPSTAGLALYYLLVPFTIIGGLAMYERGLRLIPVLSIWVMVIFTSAVTFGLTRYRVPVDVVMVIMSGIGTERLWQWFRSRSTAHVEETVP